jgi:DNA-binding MarR family transcriptional regulator
MPRTNGRQIDPTARRDNAAMATRMRTADPASATRLDDTQLLPVIGYQIAQASVLANRLYENAVGQPLGLHRLVFSLLMLVRENPGCTASSLAKALGISMPNMVLWLDRVSDKGLVEREPSQSDRRSNHLRLTAAGDEVAQTAMQALVAAEATGLARLSNAERAMLGELLHKVSTMRDSEPG